MQTNERNSVLPLRYSLIAAAVLVACLASVLSCRLFDAPAGEGRQGEWTVLFDGAGTEHWRGFRRDGFPRDAWTVQDGTLKPLVEGEVLDLITRETYQNFELELEWRVGPLGNAGIFFMVTEAHPEVWHTGPEVQILDDATHPDAEDPKTTAGSIFDLVAPADGKRLHPAGQWNHARLRVENGRLQHWLNGVRTLDVDVFGPQFRARVAESKFGSMPDFARARRGHIALQHASVSRFKAPVWYRNVRVRELP